MPFQIIRDDITKVKADAVVNTANPHPKIGGGTDSAVYKAAGAEQLLAERRKIGDIRPGDAAVTPAFALPAKYIIHTVGPVWQDGRCGEFEQLASCYRKSLLIAEQLGCESIAFPLISAGTYGFPKDKALQIALHTISEHLQNSEIQVLLVVFDRKAFEISSTLSKNVRQYIHDNYEAAFSAFEGEAEKDEEKPMLSPQPARMDTGALPVEDILKAEDENNIICGSAASLDDIVRNAEEGFQERLFRLIDERDMDDPEVYRKANISRKLFSKIRCNADYTPGKRTVLALAVALKLNLDQTVDLLSRAGLAFSPSSVFDLIVKYCIESRTYDIYEINALLFEYDQPLLGNNVLE